MTRSMCSTGWALFAAVAVSGCADTVARTTTPSPTGAAPGASCVRPTDQNGRPLYQTVSGSFVQRRIDPSGARMLLLKVPSSAADEAFPVTRDVYDAVETVRLGTRVTLLAYVGSVLSGANPAYSCIEW
jgi:hypothetical protein